jgi:hypothetical protein
MFRENLLVLLGLRRDWKRVSVIDIQSFELAVLRLTCGPVDRLTATRDGFGRV